VLGALVSKFPEKKFVTISAHDKYLNRACPASHDYVYKHFNNLNVKIYLGEPVVEIGKKIKTTKNEIEADLVIACIGFQPNTSIIKIPNALDKNGFVKVNKSLQIEGYENIFAMGDILDINEEKLAQNADKHAHIVLENISKVITGEKLSEYFTGTRPMLLSLGPSNTLFIQGNSVYFEGFLVSLIKNLVIYKTIQDYR
jgi:apoptosis-inducing factor 2